MYTGYITNQDNEELARDYEAAILVWYKRLSACHWMARTTAGIAAKTMGAFRCPFNNRKTATMNGSVIASSFVAQASIPETAAAQYQSLRATASRTSTA